MVAGVAARDRLWTHGVALAQDLLEPLDRPPSRDARQITLVLVRVHAAVAAVAVTVARTHTLAHGRERVLDDVEQLTAAPQLGEVAGPAGDRVDGFKDGEMAFEGAYGCPDSTTS